MKAESEEMVQYYFENSPGSPSLFHVYKQKLRLLLCLLFKCIIKLLK